MSFTAKIIADISNYQKGIDEVIRSTGRAEQSVGRDTDKIEGSIASMGDKFREVARSIGDSCNSMGNSLVSVGGKLSLLSAGVTAAATGLWFFAKRSGDLANNMSSVSAAIDATTDSIQEYSYVALQAGTNTKTYEQAAQGLVRRLKDVGGEGTEAVNIIRSLGVSLTDTQGAMRKTGDITNDVILALSDIQNGSERSTIANQLFGRSWVELAPMLDLGRDKIEALKEEAHALGVVLSEDTLQAGNDFSIAVGTMQMQVAAIRNEMGNAFAPLLQDTILPLLQDKIVPAIRSFADKVKGLIEAFNDLPSGVKQGVVVIASLTLALGPALTALGGVLKLLPLLSAGFTALISPVGLAIAAVAAAAALIIAYWDDIKEYFTTGGGAELFTEIRGLWEGIKTMIVTTVTYIKDTILAIWQVFGDNITGLFKSMFLFITNTLQNVVSVVKNVIKVLKGIFTLDFKSIADGLKGLFDDVMRSIAELVFAVVRNVAQGLSAFFRIIGLDSWSESLRKFADGFVVAQREINASVKDTTQEVKEQTKSVQGLAAAVQTLQGAGDIFKYFRKDGYGGAGEIDIETGSVTAGTVDFDVKGKIQAMRDLIRELDYVKEYARELSVDISQIFGEMGSDLFASLGEALATGGNVFRSLGKSLLQSLGQLAQQVGKMMIGFGVAALGLRKLITNPLGAIAAGTALIALGAAATAAVSGAVRNTTGSATVGGQSSIFTPTYRGEYQQPYTVEFRIGADELVGVLSQSNKRSDRL